MTTPAHRSPSESIVKSQPVIVHAVAAWLVSALLFAAVHFKIVVPGLTPAATAYLIPVATAVVGAGFTFSLWHFVAPAWKLAQAELKLAGVSVPDFSPEPVSVPLRPAQPAPGVVLASLPGMSGQVVTTRPDGTYEFPGFTALATPMSTSLAFNADGSYAFPGTTLPAPVDYVAQAAALTANA